MNHFNEPFIEKLHLLHLEGCNTMGKLEDADPNFFLVHDGKLLLHRNEKAHMMFMKDPAGNHKKADEQWKKLQGD